ncbi:MAG: peptidylprolyl isomerase [Nitrososphaerales archaeon]|nr:peptidylprolyl isomerase [Nitrososphaerales archaeon]
MPQKPRRRKQSGLKTGYAVGAVLLLVAVAGAGWYLYNSSANTGAIGPTTSIISSSVSVSSTPSSSSSANAIYANISTSKGLIEVELFPASAPKTVANFVNLSRSGFYNNLVWHRIVPGFVIQTGDPLTKNGGGDRSLWGTGQSSQQVPLEIDPALHNDAGYLAMAHTASSTSATSQFYINLVNNPNLDGQYTVFGKVVGGMDVVNAIAGVPIYPNQSSQFYDQPITPVYVLSITVLSGGP